MAVASEPFSCPKTMHYGPCGGVGVDGACEVSEQRCVFLDVPTVPWSGPPAAAVERIPSAERMRERLARGAVVVADFPARALDAESIAGCARVMREVDVVLAGDAGNARVQFPPSYRAALIQREGVPVWTGFNNRDRNRVALEGELAALAHVGVAGVHCVTGDHTLTGDRPDAKPVFDLDSTETAALARAAGHLVSVAASPAAVPRDRRAARLIEKERAGAEICFVNHCGGVEEVVRFIREARDLGSTARMIACVAVVVDASSAALLQSFPGLVLPEGYLDGIRSVSDVRSAGIAAAVDFAARLLDTGLVDGVDLSGGGGLGEELAFAEALAQIAGRLRL